MRRGYRVLAIVSLLLCIATVTQWVRSYFVSDVLDRQEALPAAFQQSLREVPGPANYERRELAITSGKVLLLRTHVIGTYESRVLLRWKYSSQYPLKSPDLSSFGGTLRILGGQWTEFSMASGWRNTTTFQVGVLPLWWPLALFAVVGYASWRIARIPRRRWQAGRCVKCSYNLSGNTSGVCPECGMAIKESYTRQFDSPLRHGGPGRRHTAGRSSPS